MAKTTAKFYSDVVSWTTQEMPPDGGSSYTTFNLGNDLERSDSDT
jgi:hypothetical protein